MRLAVSTLLEAVGMWPEVSSGELSSYLLRSTVPRGPVAPTLATVRPSARDALARAPRLRTCSSAMRDASFLSPTRYAAESPFRTLSPLGRRSRGHPAALTPIKRNTEG